MFKDLKDAVIFINIFLILSTGLIIIILTVYENIKTTQQILLVHAHIVEQRENEEIIKNNKLGGGLINV